MARILTIQTLGPGLYEFTQDLPRLSGDGVLTLFVQHTSCSLLIQENADPDVKEDLNAFFARLVPSADDPGMRYLRHVYEGPDDMPAHIKAALLPTSLSIPFADGSLLLGSWQGVYLFEHRARPHARRVALQVLT